MLSVRSKYTHIQHSVHKLTICSCIGRLTELRERERERESAQNIDLIKVNFRFTKRSMEVGHVSSSISVVGARVHVLRAHAMVSYVHTREEE